MRKYENYNVSMKDIFIKVPLVLHLKHSMIINISISLKKQIQKYKTKSIVFGSQYLTDMKKKLLKILKAHVARDTKVNKT